MTKKSESVRESEQRRTIEDLVYEFTLLHEPACKISREAISGGLMLLARNVIKLLAEEAEQEAKEVQLASGYEYRKFREIAEWLRMKLERS